jgi:hypothetical protein
VVRLEQDCWGKGVLMEDAVDSSVIRLNEDSDDDDHVRKRCGHKLEKSTEYNSMTLLECLPTAKKEPMTGKLLNTHIKQEYKKTKLNETQKSI